VHMGDGKFLCSAHAAEHSRRTYNERTANAK
jgi:hypothetical protein